MQTNRPPVQAPQPPGSNPPPADYRFSFSEFQSLVQSPKSTRSPHQAGLRNFVVGMMTVGLVLMVAFAATSIWSAASGRLGEIATDSGSSYTSRPPSSSELQKDQPDNHIPGATLPGGGLQLEDKPADSSAELSAVDIYKTVSPSVVGITTYQQQEKNMQPHALGSGIVLSEDGYLVTNAHVLEDADRVKVTLYNGDEYDAVIIGLDSKSDLGVLKINATGFIPAVFGNADQVDIGETVMAIGNPVSSQLGMGNSLTQGVVSALSRSVTTTGATLNCIQTDAAINPGSSGGALVNRFGQVIGITSAKMVDVTLEGVGFAISANDAKPIIDDLIANGRVTSRARLGIYYHMIDKTIAEMNQVPTGLWIASFQEDCPLPDLGVKEQDIVTKIDGVAITKAENVNAILRDKRPGDVVTLEIYSYPEDRPAQGQTFTVQMSLLGED